MLAILNPNDPQQPFPPADQALAEPNGLLAAFGCLSPERLIQAYRQGVFPWYNPDEPILWWSPNPRMVLFPTNIRISKSLKKQINQKVFHTTFDTAFPDVIRGCSEARHYTDQTWISNEIFEAYQKLFDLGYAHSIETWAGDELAGGLYGVAIGRVFYGESMFFRKSNASKVAFIFLSSLLQSWGYKLIDCQVSTAHLTSFGAEMISRNQFLNYLDNYCDEPSHPLAWKK